MIYFECICVPYDFRHFFEGTVWFYFVDCLSILTVVILDDRFQAEATLKNFKKISTFSVDTKIYPGHELS